MYLPWGGARLDEESIVEWLFDTEFSKLVGATRVLLDSREDAEEVVQEAFTRLLTSRRKMRDVDNAPAYLRTVAFNLARSRLRKRRTVRRSQPSVEHAAVLAHSAAGQLTPEAALLKEADSEAMLAALDELPVRQRECLVLRYFMSLSEAEIAKTLKISKGSVKTHTSRGLSGLRILMGGEQ